MMTTTSATFELRPAGAFALEASATFGFGPRRPGSYDGVMRMAFCLDRTWEPVGVELRQEPAGTVVGRVAGGADVDAVAAQTARILSLDHDATGYDAVGSLDPPIAPLQAAAHGLRPPLFASPYEAASWSVLSARRSATQMAGVRRALSAEHGTTFDLAGRTEACWPTPEQLLGVTGWQGVQQTKIDRLHGVARAALDGRLDVDRLRDLGPEAAQADLQGLDGIGPFYASLIAIRATGFTDVLPVDEPRLLAAVADLYGLDGPPDHATFERLAEPWRPWRTWVSVLIRATSDRGGSRP